MTAIPIKNTFYENVLGETFVDQEQNEQMYMNTTLRKVEHVKTIPMSSFVIGADDDEAFFDKVIRKIKIMAKSSEPCLLGPVYYNKDNIPTDFQCNFTETGKPDENFFGIANRGMIEESGLCFKSNAKFAICAHSITRKKSFQDCVSYIVHASQLEPVSPELCDVEQTYFNQPDYVGRKNDLKHVHKSQVFVYGTQKELDTLVKSITMKPVKTSATNSVVFYDDDIRGLTTFSIRRLNRFRKTQEKKN